MKIKFKVTLRIKPGFVNSMSLAGLMYFITIAQSNKFKMNWSMVRNDISFFNIEDGPGIWFVIKDMIQYEKKTSDCLVED